MTSPKTIGRRAPGRLGASPPAAAPTAARPWRASLWQFWWTRGHLSEGRGWLERFLERARGLTGEDRDEPREEAAPAPAQAKALLGAGFLAMQQSDWRTARARLEAGLALSRALGDPRLTAWLLR